ncbi:Glucosylceramidase domain protein [Rhodopirellula maiorica SM1]|uniref:Glucosylceramidase domain protein n=1 Tax=Rhodopirellula maiorica SM1 TaxID=1265738 RepID=M5RTG1_9BACT|nr:GH116 family glycosyl hydrolase [Rhodopirellula maiorica]EMI18672.1 Glucosylceramidase domain protein [Rhodopirellula maiorica SM1]
MNQEANTQTSNASDNCNSVPGCCGDANARAGRRQFVKATGLTAAMLMAGRTDVMAGPFEAEDFDHVIPADKKLSKQWIESLYARGEPLSATAGNLKYIGMPISGLCTGQVYLGGDGQLWYWNLTAKKDRKNNPKGVRYMQPDVARSSPAQGFALQVGGKVHTLDAGGFQDVKFTNQYPMGLVNYADKSCPLRVQLEAYTPFIPLNRDESSYPVIVMRYTVTNASPDSQDVAIAGWIDNSTNGSKGKKVGVYRALDEIATVECTADFENANAMALGVLGKEKPELVDLAKTNPGPDGVFDSEASAEDGARVQMNAKRPALASIGRKFSLGPGESKTVSFTVSWRFPMVRYGVGFGMGPKSTSPGRNHYATVYPTASEASNQLAKRESELYGTTQKWVDTWYDSSLPYWFLERAFIPINCMQTQVAQRVYPRGNNTDIYNLEEGVRCCPGNCTHVWNYAQGLARVFPEIERECRDKIEYGLGFDDSNGMIYFRYSMRDGKNGRDDALDGTCGTIIRVLRESQMTTDYRFLKSIWDRVKLSMDFVIKEWDPDEDGILAGAQHNTLDEPWYGKVHWLINVYHAALKASAVMARQMNQTSVAERYERIVAKGAPAMVEQLWNEDFGYFIHIPGDAESEKHGSTNGCHIDQVLGESWLHEVGLEPILPKDKIQRSLQSLWKYNFTPNVGEFRKVMKNGRWYAAAGDAGLVMCSFPNGKIEPKSGKASYAGYLNECMTGFEWQVAAHMIREGMVQEGLAIGKAIYDRYSPDARNPYNEVECSDHYSRAMASYGAYLAACGYRYDGPQGKLAFGPRLSPEDFRAAFTTAEGWGRFTQTVDSGQQTASLELRYGKLALKELALDKVKGTSTSQAKVAIDGEQVQAKFLQEADRYILRFTEPLKLVADQRLEIKFED